MMFADTPPPVKIPESYMEMPVQAEEETKPVEEATSQKNPFRYAYLADASDSMSIELPADEEEEKKEAVSVTAEKRSKPRFRWLSQQEDASSDESEENKPKEGLSEARKHYRFVANSGEKKGGCKCCEGCKEVTKEEEEETKESENATSEFHRYFTLRSADSLISDSGGTSGGETFPPQEQLRTYAEGLLGLFVDGFQWTDLAEMITRANNHIMGDYPHLTYDQRRDAIVRVLEYVIDITDTPYLPDNFSDPLFKLMVFPFVDLMLPSLNGGGTASTAARVADDGTPPTPEEIQNYVDRIITIYADGFQWSDLAQTVRLAIEFATSFSLSQLAQEDVVMEIINTVIDKTDTPYLPDRFTDPIFKALVKPIVSVILNAVH